MRTIPGKLIVLERCVFKVLLFHVRVKILHSKMNHSVCVFAEMIILNLNVGVKIDLHV